MSSCSDLVVVVKGEVVMGSCNGLMLVALEAAAAAVMSKCSELVVVMRGEVAMGSCNVLALAAAGMVEEVMCKCNE